MKEEKTNFQMLRDLLEVYIPERMGIATAGEVKLIKEKLRLENMSVLELRNMRDFVVAYMGVDDMDRMSAIVAVVDGELFDRNGCV